MRQRALALLIPLTLIAVGARAQTEAPSNRARAEPLSASAPLLRADSIGLTAPAPLTVTPPGTYDLSIAGDFDLGGFIFKNGYPFLHNDGGVTARNTALGMNALISTTPGVPYFYSGYENTAVGFGALAQNSSGFANTAVGEDALISNTTGSFNTATGSAALLLNSDGERNTAFGFASLSSNTSASYNTAIGDSALASNVVGLNTAVGASALLSNTTGFENTAIGHAALRDNVSGERNTAVGQAALLLNQYGSFNTAVGEDALRYSTGSGNIALGRYAGRNATTGNDNIFIGNGGQAGDSATVRIGIHNTQSKTYIAGISNATVTDAPVFVDTGSGRLGINTSSLRFKEAVSGIGRKSGALMQLRPVAFRHRAASDAANRPLEFGLIAEEVAEVLPELVVYDDQSRPLTVKYHLLSSLLLNEVQRQHEELRLHRWALAIILTAGVLVTVGRWQLAEAQQQRRAHECSSGSPARDDLERQA